MKDDPKVRRYEIRICDQCIRLEGEQCHNPACVFCRRTMEEVGEYLDVLLIRPVIDGRRAPASHAPYPRCACGEVAGDLGWWESGEVQDHHPSGCSSPPPGAPRAEKKEGKP